jgi:hypothetical protein
MPNWFAYSALLSWPLISACLYLRSTPARATIWTLLGAQYLLPAATVIKIPMIPEFDKSTIPSICVLIAWLVYGKKAPRIQRFYLADVLVSIYVLVPLATAMANSDTIVVGGTVLPGVGAYDGISASLLTLIGVSPFLVGRFFVSNIQALSEGLKALVWGGAIYSVLMLFEMKMSPQLHAWIYGFSPSDIIQQIRGGGFRPMVFMGHGLTASFFAMLSFLAAAVLNRARVRIGKMPNLVVVYLGSVMFLCRSLGATIYGALAFPLIKWGSVRLQRVVSIGLVLTALAFPLLRYTNIFPAQTVLDVFKEVSVDREKSLAVRFLNEDLLLNRASERWLLGWGRYGRSRVYSEESGQDVSVTDGRWIIDFGQYGLFGFLAEFGLLAFCVIVAAKHSVVMWSAGEKTLVAGASLLLAINVVELIPNSTLTPWSFFLSGVLIGIVENGRPLRRSQRALIRKPRASSKVE